MTRTLDSDGQLTLVMGTCPCHTAGDYLGALAEIPAQPWHVLIIDIIYFVRAERAYFFSALSSAGTTTAVAAIARIASIVGHCETSFCYDDDDDVAKALERQVSVIFKLGEIVHAAA